MSINGINVAPRTVADALQMDTHDLSKLLCTFSSDALPTETWLESEYRPLPLDDFDEAVASARRHLEAAHAAWSAWTQENPTFAEVGEAE